MYDRLNNAGELLVLRVIKKINLSLNLLLLKKIGFKFFFLNICYLFGIY